MSYVQYCHRDTTAQVINTNQEKNQIAPLQSGKKNINGTLDRLSRIASPTHIIAGDADIIFSLRLSKILAEKIPGAKLIVVRGGAHVLAFEDPTEFNPVAIDFLKQHSEK